MSQIEPLVTLVDDDAAVREAIQSLIRSEGLRVEAFASAQEFLARPRRDPPACLIVDVDLPGLTGLDLQEELARTEDPIPIIFLTGHGDIPMSVRAIKAGALEFLTKPCDADLLLAAIREGIALSTSTQGRSSSPGAEGSLGESPAWRKVLHQVDLVAETDATVLITGESGTGKELVARTIHERSARHAGPLVDVNCGAIPDTLFENEFFGSVKGAFTGATRDKPGRFELANGGTLFLDEIGDVPIAVQPKLLRALQEKEVERVGDTRPRKLDVRIIAATNRDLSAEVVAGRFRQDLFYRLSVFPIETPPLRARREDIPRLAEHFSRRAARRLGCRSPRLSESVARELAAHDWPGNVRELENAVERAVILARDGPLRFDFLPKAKVGAPAEPAAEDAPLLTRDELKQRERESIAVALARTGGKVSGPNGAAALLGMKPTTLHSRILALKLERKLTRTT